MALTRREMMIGSGALALLASLPARASATDATQVLDGPAFGTGWRVVLPVNADAAAARRAVETVVGAVDTAMSPWRADSEVSRFNRSAQTGWQDASAETCTVAAEALEVARLTGGAFDPTVGPLVARYGFGPITGPLTQAGRIDCQSGALSKSDPGLTLDLCGIAKGHALDRIGAQLRIQGISDALIELGGEVLALGTHPEGRPWQVAIETPGVQPFAAQRIVAPGPLALATSGHTPQGYNGPRGQISHLIDPVTNRPALSALASVSVLARTGCRADALATAFTVLGPRAGPALARRLNIPALFLIRHGGGIEEAITSGFDRYIIV